MKHFFRDIKVWAVLVLAGGLTAACSAAPISPNRTPSALDPAGPMAGRLESLWWLMFWLGTAIWVLVVALLFAALLRRKRGSSATPPESHVGDTGRNWIMAGGIALPLVIIGITFGYSTYTLAKVNNSPQSPAVRIQVSASQWWWEFQYPDSSVTTANEIHIPVGWPVQIQIQASDVIHSFWVPELHGKMDAIPNRINYLTIQADKPGIYRGECAEYCGLQHAHMDFMVVAESETDYENWISAQQQPAVTPTDPTALQGQQVFVAQRCIFCHTVRGLEDKPIDRSAVELGPDLTHLASRLTIGGGSLTLNEGNLGGWIVDVQHVKPGALMPDMTMNSQDLQALLAYLLTLK